MKYIVSIIYDEDYDGYVVDVPQLPGCMSQGKTVDEALLNIKEAISLYIEVEGVEDEYNNSDIITAVVEV